MRDRVAKNPFQMTKLKREGNELSERFRDIYSILNGILLRVTEFL